MHSASVEWMARVAARNEIEEAKALRAWTPASTRLVALSAGANSADGRDARRPLEGGAK